LSSLTALHEKTVLPVVDAAESGIQEIILA